ALSTSKNQRNFHENETAPSDFKGLAQGTLEPARSISPPVPNWFGTLARIREDSLGVPHLSRICLGRVSQVVSAYWFLLMVQRVRWCAPVPLAVPDVSHPSDNPVTPLVAPVPPP